MVVCFMKVRQQNNFKTFAKSKKVMFTKDNVLHVKYVVDDKSLAYSILSYNGSEFKKCCDGIKVPFASGIKRSL